MNQETPNPDRAAFLLLLLLAAILLLTVGCSRVQYVPIREVEHRIEYRDSVRYDSVHVADSTYLRVSPDTVYQYRLRTEYRYLFRHRRDTILRRDTVQVPVPVERKLSRWEQAKMDFGGVAIGAVGLALTAVVIWICLIKRYRRKEV